MGSNYLRAEIDNPEEFKAEMLRLKELSDKFVAETGFPF